MLLFKGGDVSFAMGLAVGGRMVGLGEPECGWHDVELLR